MIFPWKRFWVRPDAQISCGLYGDGFFDDPDDDWSRNKSIAHTLDSLLESKCLVLSGEPGLGKSVALEQAFPHIDHAAGGKSSTIWIRFRDIPDSTAFTRRVFESPRWKSWTENDEALTLVLDGLDEGLIKIKDFVSFLTRELRSSPHDRLKLITACRTADWPVAAGNRLLRLWDTDLTKSFWELCPLRRVDAELAAKHVGVQTEEFLEQVFEKHVTTLAARPTTLLFLCGSSSPMGNWKELIGIFTNEELLISVENPIQNVPKSANSIIKAKKFWQRKNSATERRTLRRY
jgi:hypothetical protein